MPKHWRIQAIDGLNEAGVADLLQRSKIFMSFSHFEGCPLPPLEAALCGNQIIGYTGQGAKEYWDTRIFSAIESGDVIQFAITVLDKIKVLDAHPEFTVHTDVIRSLSAKYSPTQELIDMKKFLQTMGLMSTQ